MFIGVIAICELQILSSLSLSSSSLSIFMIPPDFFGNLVKSTIALFVVIDPIGSVPLFIVLTEKMDKNERTTVSKITTVTAAAVQYIVQGTKHLF